MRSHRTVVAGEQKQQSVLSRGALTEKEIFIVAPHLNIFESLIFCVVVRETVCGCVCAHKKIGKLRSPKFGLNSNKITSLLPPSFLVLLFFKGLENWKVEGGREGCPDA